MASKEKQKAESRTCCCIQFTTDFFDTVLSGSLPQDYTPQSPVTYGCLDHLLRWSKDAKQSAQQLSPQLTGHLPAASLTDIAHIIIRNLSDAHSAWSDQMASTSAAEQFVLKPSLPIYGNLSRAVRNHQLCHGVNCNEVAHCLYVSQHSSTAQTPCQRQHRRRENADVYAAHCSAECRRMAAKRRYPEVCASERVADRTHRAARRQDPAVRASERVANQTRREDPAVRARELVANRTRRAVRREDPAVRVAERAANRTRVAARRQHPIVRAAHNVAERRRRKSAAAQTAYHLLQRARMFRRRASVPPHIPATDLIRSFHSAVKSGPIYICSSCDQLFYKQSVMKADTIRRHRHPLVVRVLRQTPSVNDIEWICCTCAKYLRRGNMPPLSLANSLQFPPVPPHLPQLTFAEWRLLSPRIAFMRIFEAPMGKQFKIRGNVVNVPSDVSSTLHSLPRVTSQCETVAMAFKRRQQYQHSVLSANIRPECIRVVGKYLVEHGPLFQAEQVSFSDSILQTVSEEVMVSADVEPAQSASSETADLPTVPAVDQATLADNAPMEEPPNASGTTSDDDQWNELDLREETRPGTFDTMFTSPDFVEDTERQRVFDSRGKVYSFAPAEGNKPISVFMDKFSEELAFPGIYWGHSRAEPKIQLPYTDLVKSELRRSDRRAAQCIENLFFKLKKVQMQRITSQISVAVRKHKNGGKVFTAGQLRDPGSIDRLIQFDDGYRVLKELRASPPYWEKAGRDLLAMIRQLGPATIFLSLSAAETHWTHLLKILSKVVDSVDLTDEQCTQLTWSEKCRLISSDPVTCARHFDYSFRQFLSLFLKSPNCPFGKLQDYWWRYEAQGRGSLHVHALLWIADAPQYGINPHEEVTQYIDQISTCQQTWDDEYLNSLVTRQVHKHSRTCRKRIRKNTVCRFGFPKFPMHSTQILEPLVCDPIQQKEHEQNHSRIKSALVAMKAGDDTLTVDQFLQNLNLTHDDYILALRSSLKTATVFLRRSPGELRINSYNPDCMLAWRANHDVQYILDVFSCAAYVTSYVAKTERGMSDLLRSACQEAKQGNVNLKQQVRLIGNKFLNNVEVSAQEAVLILLQIPLKQASRQVTFINTSPPEERVYLLKTNLEQLPDDAEVAESNLISRYIHRPAQLESVTLADFAALYDGVCPTQTAVRHDSAPHSNADTDVLQETQCLRQPKRRRVPRVIRSARFNADKNPEKHAREQLMLYTPWRNEVHDLYGGFGTYADRYECTKSSLVSQLQTYEPFSPALDDAQVMIAAEMAEEQWELMAPVAQQSEVIADELGDTPSATYATVNPELHGQSGFYDLGPDLGLAGTSTAGTVHRFHMEDDEYFALMQSLNTQQMEFITDTVHLLKASNQPLYRFLSGGAGTGKSYVLKALRECLERFYKTRCGTDFRQSFCMTVAPTGKAAYIAGGQTIHSVLHVPANQSFTYSRLDHDTLNTLRTQIGHIKVWLIDEISMVGNRMMAFIDQRLQDVYNSNHPFGGSSVIAFGDLFQLPPVLDSFVFADLSKTRQADDYSALAPNLWKDNFMMFELKQIMRQQDCIPFADLLNRLREGNHTAADIDLLATRSITPASPSYPLTAQHLFRTNMEVDAHNCRVFDTSPYQKFTVSAVDSVVGAVSKDMASRVLAMIPSDTRKTVQLPGKLQLVLEGRYELSSNVNVADGLANGTSGVIKKVDLAGAESRASGIVWVDFGDSVGVQTRTDNRSLYKLGISPQWVPVHPISRQFQVGRSRNCQVMRKQFPLRHSAAKTIHRAQGDTLDEVVVDFSSSRKQAHIHYVGLSRVRKLEGLHILNLCHGKIHISPDVQQEMAELRDRRQLPLSLPRIYCLNSQLIKVAFLNARSVHAHFQSIVTDQSLMACHVHMYCETFMNSEEMRCGTYNIDGYSSLIYPSQCPMGSRPHYGLALYSSLPIVHSQQLASIQDRPVVSNIECVLIVVQLSTDIYLNVACLYRRPSTPLHELQRVLQALLTHLHELHSTGPAHQYDLIVGDFNVDLTEQSNIRTMNQLLPNYRQLVTDPTTDYQSIIDHVYTDIPAEGIDCFTGESFFSDHKPIFVTLTKGALVRNQ